MSTSTGEQNTTLNMVIGSMTILVLTLIAIALIFSTRKDLLDTHDDYYIITFYYNIGLLETGAPVRFRGVQVGRVTDIRLEKDLQIRVECKIKMSNKIPSDSKLAVAATTVSGDTYLNLIEGIAPTTLAPADNPQDAPVVKGLNYIDIRSIGSAFTDMQEVTSVLISSLSRLFGKDSYTIQQYHDTIKKFPRLKQEFDGFNTEKSHLMEKFSNVQNEILSIKDEIECCMKGILEKYPMEKIQSDIQTISTAFSELSKTMKTIQNNGEFANIQGNINAVSAWAGGLEIKDRSVLGIILSKGCGGMTKTIEMVNHSVETAQDFSIFKLLGFYFDGKSLLANFEKRTNAEYLPASEYMYRWSVFSYERYRHNCDLPCGEKSCPPSLR